MQIHVTHSNGVEAVRYRTSLGDVASALDLPSDRVNEIEAALTAGRPVAGGGHGCEWLLEPVKEASHASR